MSAFSLGSIRAVLGIDTGGYTKGLLDAQVANEVFGHTVTNFINNPLLGTVQLLKNVAGATASAVRETAFLNQEYLRSSQRVGVSTETISGLQMAYRDMGLSAAELEKHLVILSKLVDDAANGNEQARKTFERLGVSVTDLNGRVKSNDEIFREASDGLARLGNEQAKVSLANDLFGRGAEKVLDVVGRGGKAIEEYIDKSRRFGQVVEDDAARGSDRLASSLGDLGFAFEGAKRRISTSFAGALGNELDGVEKALERINSKAESFATTAERAGTSFGRWLSEMLEGYEILEEKQLAREQALKREQDQLNSFQSVDDARNLLRGTGVDHYTGGLGAQSIGIPSYREAVREELSGYGVTEADVIRSAYPHYPDDIAADLADLHRRQEAARTLRARQ